MANKRENTSYSNMVEPCIPKFYMFHFVIKSPFLTHKQIDAPVPMYWLHQEILFQIGQEQTQRLMTPPKSIYAGAWPDYYWRKAFGGQFSEGYRLKRTKDRIVLMHEQGQCYQYVLGFIDERFSCSQAETFELQQLFLSSKTGTLLVSPSDQTLEHLRKLGYVNQEEEP